VQALNFVCLSIKDTGHGMDTATLARVFEPFFTTKDPGKGTGMGLATVYGILRQHNGWIDVESEPNRGTTFRVYLPLSEDGVAEVRTELASPLAGTSLTKQMTILVVEDEEMLREFVTEALGMLGYRILAAENGQRALEIWAEHRDEIDLLLAHTLVMDRPDLKVIFTSGYSAELIGPEFEQDRVHGFLAKPYLTDTLANTVAAQFQMSPPQPARGLVAVSCAVA
jgi:CheY-like chemotaxis protein